MESYYGVVNPEDVPCEKIYCGCAYFIAMNYVLRGEYSKASEKMDYIMYMADEGISKDLINKSEFSFLQAVKYYVSAMASIDNHEIVMEYLRTLFDEYICNRVDDIFIDQRNVIIKQYPCLTKNSITNREKYGLLEEHEMDSIIADSNEKTVASDVASSATAGAAAAGCAVAASFAA